MKDQSLRCVDENMRRSGFSLIELLVSVSIISLLMSLLLPAVQSAREASRRLECANHIKQLSLACHLHQEMHGFLPSGGWGPSWLGDPKRAMGRRQPGGWIYAILPYIELQSLHDLPPTDPSRIVHPVPLLNCPTRRPSMVFTGSFPSAVNGPQPLPPDAARADYAANMGDGSGTVFESQPSSYEEADGTTYTWPDTSKVTGICFLRSEITMAMITDGTSSTYLLGEKYVTPEHYRGWIGWDHDYGDDYSMFCGQQDDIVRAVAIPNPSPPNYVLLPPVRDRYTLEATQSFGSAHAHTLNMSMCDGSVHQISYSIDAEVHRRLGNRQDGLTISGSVLE